MKDQHFTTYFSPEKIPNYNCPKCKKGTLQKESFNSHSTAASNRDRGEDWWEPEHEESVFQLTLKCSNCNELVFCHGDGFIEEEYEIDDDEGWSRTWVSYHRPKNFFPALKFIDCPPATPSEVQDSLETAAALYYSTPSASCNSLRIAAEDILTALGIPESSPGNFTPFGARIKQLPEDSHERLLLDAIRWLGNSGSHSGSAIKHKDAEHAFNVIDLLVEEVFSERKKKIRELAAAIIKNKGPVTPRDL